MRRAGFTLIELIAVIVVLAVLAGVAIPKYNDFATKARMNSAAYSLKVLRQAFIQYREANGAYPLDQNGGIMPPEILPYIEGPNTFSYGVPGVGKFNWEGPPGWDGNECISISGLVTVPASPTTDSFWVGVDKLIDDGDLANGSFRWDGGSTRYRWSLNPWTF